MNGKVRIGLAQTSSSLGGVAANLAKHEELIGKAREAGCSILCFPELSLTGYVLRDLAYHMSAPCREAIQAIARKSAGMRTIVGFVEEGRRGMLYNSAAVVSDGNVMRVSRKLFLPTYGLFEEKRYFTEGESAGIAVVKGEGACDFDFGVCICEDAWHFQPPAILSAMGAELIFCPAASPARGYSAAGGLGIRETWRSLASAHAIINNAFFAFVNNAGSQDSEGFFGGSFIASPSGKIVCEAKEEAEDFLVAELDLDDVRAARTFSSFRDRRPELSELLGRLCAR